MEIKCRWKDKAGRDRRSPSSNASSTSPLSLFLLPIARLGQIGLIFFFLSFFLLLIFLFLFNFAVIIRNRFCFLFLIMWAVWVYEGERIVFYWVVWFFKREKFIWSCYNALQVKRAIVATHKKKKGKFLGLFGT